MTIKRVKRYKWSSVQILDIEKKKSTFDISYLRCYPRNITSLFYYDQNCYS